MLHLTKDSVGLYKVGYLHHRPMQAYDKFQFSPISLELCHNRIWSYPCRLVVLMKMLAKRTFLASMIDCPDVSIRWLSSSNYQGQKSGCCWDGDDDEHPHSCRCCSALSSLQQQQFDACCWHWHSVAVPGSHSGELPCGVDTGDSEASGRPAARRSLQQSLNGVQSRKLSR